VLVSPGPGKYQTIDCFTYITATPYKVNMRPVFPKDERKVFKEEISNGVQQPGPGNYHIISEFGNYETTLFQNFNSLVGSGRSSLTKY
jgi:hypothetical protein